MPRLGQGPPGSSPIGLWGSWFRLPLPLPFAPPGSQVYCDSCSAGRGLGRAHEFLRKDWEWREPHLSRAPSVLHTCPACPIPSPTIPLPFCCPGHHLLIWGTCHSPVHRSPFFSPPNLLPTWPGLFSSPAELSLPRGAFQAKFPSPRMGSHHPGRFLQGVYDNENLPCLLANRFLLGRPGGQGPASVLSPSVLRI